MNKRSSEVCLFCIFTCLLTNVREAFDLNASLFTSLMRAKEYIT